MPLGSCLQECCEKLHSEPIISTVDTKDDDHVYLATVGRHVMTQHLLELVPLELNEDTVKRFGKSTFNPNIGYFMVSGLGSMRLVNDRQLCARRASTLLHAQSTHYGALPRSRARGTSKPEEWDKATACPVWCDVHDQLRGSAHRSYEPRVRVGIKIYYEKNIYSL